MHPPIIINDSTTLTIPGDVRVYSTVDAAERSLEVGDGPDPQIHVVDSNGLRLKIVTDSEGKGVRLVPGESQPSHRDALEEVLRAFLTSIGYEKQAQRMSLAQLLDAAYQRSPNPYT